MHLSYDAYAYTVLGESNKNTLLHVSTSFRLKFNTMDRMNAVQKAKLEKRILRLRRHTYVIEKRRITQVGLMSYLLL